MKTSVSKKTNESICVDIQVPIAFASFLLFSSVANNNKEKKRWKCWRREHMRILSWQHGLAPM
jgi:hypothetical protein